MNIFEEKALKKLDAESKKKPTGREARVVFEPVIIAVKEFVRQDEEFAQAVVQTDKTIDKICEEIMKGVSRGISDIEVYRRVVKEYFPGAEVDFLMKVRVNPYDEQTKRFDDVKLLDITDFL